MPLTMHMSGVIPVGGRVHAHAEAAGSDAEEGSSGEDTGSSQPIVLAD